MPHFNEHALEMGIMELFEQQGYSYQSGETIHKELSDVLLCDDLKLYLMDRYSAEGITVLEIERVIAKPTADNGASLYQHNAQTYRLMTEGFTIKREDASQPDFQTRSIARQINIKKYEQANDDEAYAQPMSKSVHLSIPYVFPENEESLSKAAEKEDFVQS